jgi:ribosomal protein L37AE/L43A
MSDTREHWTIWVCTNCLHHHANGECGDCHNPDGHEGGDPLSLLSNHVSMGMVSEEHECNSDENGIEYGECDCETNTHSTSTCQGCGSDFHGERHAMTEWSE